MKTVNEMLEDEECKRAYQRGYDDAIRSRSHTSAPEQYAELEKANQSLAAEVMRLVVEQDKAAAQAREQVLDALGTRLNSWISAMEILDSKHPSPLRKGIIMAYRDVEEWERQMRKSPMGGNHD